MRAVIHNSDGEIEFGVDGELVRVETSEKVDIFVGRTFVSGYVSKYLATQTDGLVALLPTTLAEARGRLNKPGFADAEYYRVDPQVLPLVKALDNESALGLFNETFRRNTASATRLLRNYIRLYPERTHELATWMAQITDSNEDAERIDFLWASIANAGHPEAQASLLEVIASGDYSPEASRNALMSLIGVEQPEKFLLDGLWAYRQQLANDDTSARNAFSRSIATNMYGVLGDHEKGNPDLSALAASTLLDALEPGQKTVQTVELLGAVSNIGSFELIA